MNNKKVFVSMFSLAAFVCLLLFQNFTFKKQERAENGLDFDKSSTSISEIESANSSAYDELKMREISYVPGEDEKNKKDDEKKPKRGVSSSLEY